MVRGSVEDHLSPLLRGRIDRASGAEVEALGRRAIEEVWSDFAKMLARGNPPDDSASSMTASSQDWQSGK